mmetsp:Transcript_4670/g.6906  ORF Transcript_4670/g.6906 Transcript_4670/m.6906 type:complete len:360 (-) Transcript_4670:662-1741(-)
MSHTPFRLKSNQHDLSNEKERKFIMKTRDNLKDVPLSTPASSSTSSQPIQYNYLSVFEAEIKRLQAQKLKDAQRESKNDDFSHAPSPAPSFEKGLHTIVRVRRRPSELPLESLYLDHSLKKKKTSMSLEQEILRKELTDEMRKKRYASSTFSLVTSNADGLFVKHKDLMLKQKASKSQRLSVVERQAKRAKKLRLTRITKMRDSDVYDFEDEHTKSIDSDVIYDYYVETSSSSSSVHPHSTFISLEPIDGVTFHHEYEDQEDPIDFDDEDREDHPNYDYGNYEAILGDPENEDLYNEFDYSSNGSSSSSSSVDAFEGFHYGYAPPSNSDDVSSSFMMDDDDDDVQDDAFFHRLSNSPFH